MVAVDGAFAIRNKFGDLTVPPGCAAWIPARLRHAIDPAPRALTRTLYISTGATTPAVLAISPFVHAIVDHVCAAGRLDAAAAKPIAAVLLDQLPRQRALPLFVPALTSELARSVAAAWHTDPADTLRIRDVAAVFHVSPRTLERAFVTDAKMSPGEWRQRTRICRAVALLAGGMAVQDVALEVGYETPSAFVAAFKKYVGTTPGKIAAHVS